MHQKWPNKIFSIVNFVFSPDGHFGLGRGGAWWARRAGIREHCVAVLWLSTHAPSRPCSCHTGGGPSCGGAAEQWRRPRHPRWRRIAQAVLTKTGRALGARPGEFGGWDRGLGHPDCPTRWPPGQTLGAHLRRLANCVPRVRREQKGLVPTEFFLVMKCIGDSSECALPWRLHRPWNQPSQSEAVCADACQCGFGRSSGPGG